MIGNAFMRDRALAAACGLVVALSGGLLASRDANAQTSTPRSEPTLELKERIERLIQQLDADTFGDRQRAEDDLAKIGEPARAALEAAAQDRAVERSRRAVRLLKQLEKSELGLRYVAHVQRPELQGAVTVTTTRDGKFVYVPAFSSATVNVFRRDASLGTLELIQSLRQPQVTRGVLRVKLSPDERLAASSCIHARTILLYRRDAATGMLELIDIARNGQGGVMLQWPTDVCFSADGKYLYAVEPKGAHMHVFEIGEDETLTLIETSEGQDACYEGARAMTMHPRGEMFFVVATTGKLSVHRRDANSGKLTVTQIVKDEQEDVRGLAGVWDVACSPDGNHVYTCSGRNGGDQAVSVFEFRDDGTLRVIEEFVNDEDQFRGFTGGNKIQVTPDGRYVYASGTTSGGLACFERQPQTGRLKYLGTLHDETTGKGSTLGVCGIGFSSDDRLAYFTLETDGAISIFARTVPAQ